MHEYWSASRKRADHWHEDLRLLRIQLDSCGANRRAELWFLLQRTIESILVSEVLSRVVAAVTDVLQAREIDADSAAIAANVHGTHLEARHRCLQLLVSGPGQPVDQAVALNRLRFGLEAITDVLLARLECIESTEKFCFHGTRVRELMADSVQSTSVGEDALRWALLTSAIRQNLRRYSASAGNKTSPHSQVNHAVLKAIRPNWFRIVNARKSLSAIRMENLVSEADDMVSSISNPEPPSPAVLAGFDSFLIRCGPMA
jgi:hypothetical protein